MQTLPFQFSGMTASKKLFRENAYVGVSDAQTHTHASQRREERERTELRAAYEKLQ